MRALYLKMTAFCTYYTNESDPKRKVVGSNSARNANLKSGDRKNGSRFFHYCMQKIVSGLQKNHPADRSREIVLAMKASFTLRAYLTTEVVSIARWRKNKIFLTEPDLEARPHEW